MKNYMYSKKKTQDISLGLLIYQLYFHQSLGEVRADRLLKLRISGS